MNINRVNSDTGEMNIRIWEIKSGWREIRVIIPKLFPFWADSQSGSHKIEYFNYIIRYPSCAILAPIREVPGSMLCRDTDELTGHFRSFSQSREARSRGGWKSVHCTNYRSRNLQNIKDKHSAQPAAETCDIPPHTCVACAEPPCLERNLLQKCMFCAPL